MEEEFEIMEKQIEKQFQEYEDKIKAEFQKHEDKIKEEFQEREALSFLVDRLHKEANRPGSRGRKKRLSGALAIASLLYLKNRNRINEQMRERQ